MKSERVELYGGSPVTYDQLEHAIRGFFLKHKVWPNRVIMSPVAMSLKRREDMREMGLFAEVSYTFGEREIELISDEVCRCLLCGRPVHKEGEEKVGSEREPA